MNRNTGRFHLKRNISSYMFNTFCTIHLVQSYFHFILILYFINILLNWHSFIHTFMPPVLAMQPLLPLLISTSTTGKVRSHKAADCCRLNVTAVASVKMEHQAHSSRNSYQGRCVAIKLQTQIPQRGRIRRKRLGRSVNLINKNIQFQIKF